MTDNDKDCKTCNRKVNLICGYCGKVYKQTPAYSKHVKRCRYLFYGGGINYFRFNKVFYL